MADIDLIDLLAADHQTLVEADDTSLVSLLSQHMSVERDILYQGITEYCLDGEGTVQALRGEERRLEDAMSAFESRPEEANRAALRVAVSTHIASLETLFPELRKCIPGWWLSQVVNMVPAVIGGSPTHGHPSLAAGGPVGEVAEDLSAIADYIRNRAHRRR